MSTRPPLTLKGSERLKAELQRLKTEDRPQIIQAIATAREHGDLKENAEYHAAREQQSFCEGRIKELESNLSMAQIIDVTIVGAANPGKVVFGATVELEDVESGNSITYQIVGDIEADIKHNRIAISSPIARAMIGKEEGDVAVVQAPGGVREYEIVAVSYQ
ncbi:transcription elongation factor GreA [Thiothrix sp.]|uniref:transcription elongation factor GreA n=1 Tax=Thiothrix sp. TaxID=1032 RepID=UPI0025800526|nr:transcription elongation factor GreA [Thiothrix sp.]